MVIGLFVVGAVLANYVTTGAAGVQQTAVSQMTEDAQIAFAVLARDIQMAGYAQVSTITGGAPGQTATFARSTSVRPILACEQAFTDSQAAYAQGACAAGATASHSIEVNFHATTLTAVTTSGGVPADCLGTAITTVTTGTFGAIALNSNRYFVTATVASGRPELHCASQDSAAQPLVENVEFMKIWYGVAPGWNNSQPATRQPQRYVTASQLAAIPATENDIVSVRICLIMRTADPVLNASDVTEDATLAGYADCDFNAQTSADRRLRRAFFSTVALRNKMGF